MYALREGLAILAEEVSRPRRPLACRSSPDRHLGITDRGFVRVWLVYGQFTAHSHRAKKNAQTGSSFEQFE